MRCRQSRGVLRAYLATMYTRPGALLCATVKSTPKIPCSIDPTFSSSCCQFTSSCFLHPQQQCLRTTAGGTRQVGKAAQAQEQAKSDEQYGPALYVTSG